MPNPSTIDACEWPRSPYANSDEWLVSLGSEWLELRQAPNRDVDGERERFAPESLKPPARALLYRSRAADTLVNLAVG